MSYRSFILTIPAGQTLSNEYDLGEDGNRAAQAVSLYTPDIGAGKIRLETCGPRGNFCTLQTSMIDIVIDSLKATQIMILNASKIRVRADGPVPGASIYEFVPNPVVGASDKR